MAASTTRLQVGAGHTDTMPDLRELPDRQGRMKLGVSSDKLIGTTLDWFGKTFKIVDKSQKTNWKSDPVDREHQGLGRNVGAGAGSSPATQNDEKGQIMAYDATVWDWKWDGNMARRRAGKHRSESQVSMGGQVG